MTEPERHALNVVEVTFHDAPFEAEIHDASHAGLRLAWASEEGPRPEVDAECFIHSDEGGGRWAVVRHVDVDGEYMSVGVNWAANLVADQLRACAREQEDLETELRELPGAVFSMWRVVESGNHVAIMDRFSVFATRYRDRVDEVVDLCRDACRILLEGGSHMSLKPALSQLALASYRAVARDGKPRLVGGTGLGGERRAEARMRLPGQEN